eukprot:CAMPEP_0184864930 /NCGR_PEP_ID=MMETSP0580-20130426/16397_1 /TAXON_ID=1118495 /ORGANISM="Dactyliosolen fragilissimus" /LENGTH=405 /DNA_ID=CAMNT_0027363895 /DNA_START=45 /DNA_END=1262 /DNA_ORIENTATION=+
MDVQVLKDKQIENGAIPTTTTTNTNTNTNTTTSTMTPMLMVSPEIRGMLGDKGDSTDWLDAVSKFPNGVPRFESRAECLDFMIDYNTYHGGSNPTNPNLMHIFTMLTTWVEIEDLLLPQIERARLEPSFAESVPKDVLRLNPNQSQNQNNSSQNQNGVMSSKDEETQKNGMMEEKEDQEQQQQQQQQQEQDRQQKRQNIYESSEGLPVLEDVSYRLNLPIHRCTTRASTMNTLKYLFFHMKCGIFVMIRNSKLRIFAPFVNSEYRNTWGDKLTLEGDGSIDSYYTQKAGQYREELVEPDKTKWWANGNIICNELSKPQERQHMQHWGDHFLSPLRDMLGEACRTRNMPDCEFFLNKRDYPQLKVHVTTNHKNNDHDQNNNHRHHPIISSTPVEPYGFIQYPNLLR